MRSFLFLAALAAAPPTLAADIIGRATVIDGNTIEIHGPRKHRHGGIAGSIVRLI